MNPVDIGCERRSQAGEALCLCLTRLAPTNRYQSALVRHSAVCEYLPDLWLPARRLLPLFIDSTWFGLACHGLRGV